VTLFASAAQATAAGRVVELSSEYLDLAPVCDRTACGARPWETRTAIDQRVLDDINNKTGRVLNSPTESSYIDTTVTPNVFYQAAPGYLSMAVHTRTLTPPSNPISKTDLLAWIAQYEV
jgi:hypothetical protein